jgi:hypothetical protein
MPAPGQSPLDGNPNANPPTTVGMRPTINDFDGAACTDVPASPPAGPSQPRAACWNTFGYFAVSVGKAMDVAGLSVTSGASPTVNSWWTAANKIALNPFTLTRTGAGRVQVTWTSGLFPRSGRPKADLNAPLGAHTYAISAYYLSSPPAGMDGLEVDTNQDSAGADLDFQVSLF